VLPAPGWDVDDVLAAVDQEHVTRVTVDEGGRALGRAVATAFPHIGVVVAATADHTDARDVAAERRTINVPGGTVDVDRVETRVESHRGVAACRVVALATRSGPPAIVALVVAAERNYLDAAELRAWARLKLAAHETPRAWLLVDAIDPDATDAELRAIAVERLRVR
jgi:acyl-CoA synthetase (AMP-forming)/AMP-acid ligase II